MRTVLAACDGGAGGMLFGPRGVHIRPLAVWTCEPGSVKSAPASVSSSHSALRLSRSSSSCCSGTSRLLREAHTAATRLLWPALYTKEKLEHVNL